MIAIKEKIIHNDIQNNIVIFKNRNYLNNINGIPIIWGLKKWVENIREDINQKDNIITGKIKKENGNVLVVSLKKEENQMILLFLTYFLLLFLFFVLRLYNKYFDMFFIGTKKSNEKNLCLPKVKIFYFYFFFSIHFLLLQLFLFSTW